MTTSIAAVELPTNRQSGSCDEYFREVHDPNYIPVLQGSSIHADFSPSAFSALPGVSTPQNNLPHESLQRSNSGSAPESVVQGSEGRTEKPSTARRPVSSRCSAAVVEIGSSHQPSHEDLRTRNPSGRFQTNTWTEPETVGSPRRILQDRIFMVPGMPMLVASRLEEPLIQHIANSARSSVSSVSRKSNVPISKYSSKSISVPPAVPTKLSKSWSSDALLPRSKHSSETEIHLLPSTVRTQPASTAPIAPTVENHEASASAKTSSPLAAAKSAVAERRAQALQSHPQNILTPCKAPSTTDDANETQLGSKPASRPSSMNSHHHSLGKSQGFSPPLTAPLPHLPSTVTNDPPARDGEKCSKITSSSLASHSLGATMSRQPSTCSSDANRHVEMAEFMVTQKTTVFRRFDQVHISLLLQLQDEITVLEKALFDGEYKRPERPESCLDKDQIMRDLRRTLAEYDHLFANWSSMQANKATTEIVEKLSTWLQNKNPESMSSSACKDLFWLQNTTDLSSVSMDSTARPRDLRPHVKSAPQVGYDDSGGNRSGLFATLLGLCGGHRK